MPAVTQWRLYFANNNGGSSYGLTELELRAVPGGSDLTTGGSASASSVSGGNVAANAIDNSTGTIFRTNVATVGQYLDITLTAAADINQIVITGDSTAANSPDIFLLQYYDSGAGAYLTTGVFHAGSWTASQVRTFDVPSLASNKRYWQLLVLAVQGPAATNVVLQEISMNNGGANLLLSGTASASTSFDGTTLPANAIDGLLTSGNPWSSIATPPGPPPPHWWRVDMGSAIKCGTRFSLTSYNDAGLYYQRIPTHFFWCGSNDLTNWRAHGGPAIAAYWASSGAQGTTQHFNNFAVTDQKARRFCHFLEHSP